MGNPHAALIREAEYLKQPLHTLTFTAQSHKTPLLISPALGDSFNRRESCHTLRACHSSGLKITPLKHEIGVPLKHALNLLGYSGWAQSSSPSFLDKEGSKLVLPF